MGKIDLPQGFIHFWRGIPEQVKRLLFVFAILVIVLILARSLLVPPDFGKYGHFRASAVDDVIAQEMRYAGQETCLDCHDDVAAVKMAGYHKSIACEVCHGPAAAHLEDPGEVKLPAPTGRDYCTLCHEYLPARPTGFPQIIAASHNPIKPCISCHKPHDPVPPETPRNCDACHANIARSKAVSHHAYVDCTRCHATPEAHKTNPRTHRPAKPQTREFCGGCHGTDATEAEGIPKVDLATHGQRYVCWQCHYPHLPEAN